VGLEQIFGFVGNGGRYMKELHIEKMKVDYELIR
jgi:hypothetical protein